MCWYVKHDKEVNCEQIHFNSTIIQHIEAIFL